MRMPTNHKANQDLLTPDMIIEKQWLAENAPIFGRQRTEEYTARSITFNALCDKLGATFCKVI